MIASKRFHQTMKRGEAWVAETPIGMAEQLLQSLIEAVDRLEEGDRVGDVDQDRQPQLTGGIPERGETRIVRHQQVAVGILEVEAEVFPDFEPLGTRRHRLAETGDETIGETGGGRLGPVDVAEGGEAAGIGTVVTVEVGLKLVAPAAVEVDHPGHAAFVHQGEESGDILDHPIAVGREPAAEVVVGIDDREAGAPDGVRGDLQAGARLVVAQQDIGGGTVHHAAPPIGVGEEAQRAPRPPVPDERAVFHMGHAFIGHGRARALPYTPIQIHTVPPFWNWGNHRACAASISSTIA